MLIRFTQDIKTKKTVYAVCDNRGNAKYLTTSVTKAISLAQGKK
jgi:hypothetical protein